jgi:hypothetical protein
MPAAFCFSLSKYCSHSFCSGSENFAFCFSSSFKNCPKEREGQLESFLLMMTKNKMEKLLAVYLKLLKKAFYNKNFKMKRLLICAGIALGIMSCNSGTDSSTTSSDSTTITTEGNSPMATDTGASSTSAGSTGGGSMDTTTMSTRNTGAAGTNTDTTRK